MKLIKIMLPVIALLAVGTGCANKNDVNNNADNNIKVAEQYNNKESLDEENRILYEACTNRNIATSCNNLGYAYDMGQSVKQDYSKAIIYYEKACSLSDYFGCYNLGNLYNNGRGVKKDYSKANIYYEKACNLNNDIGFAFYLNYNMKYRKNLDELIF